MIKTKRYCTAVLLTLSLGIITQSETVSAASVPGVQSTLPTAAVTDSITPEFADPTEALRAANRAREAVIANSDLEGSLSNVENAQRAVSTAMHNDDPNTMRMASKRLEEASRVYMKNLAEVTGVSEADLLSMHDDGMKWGEVGHELGVHSNLIGFGHTTERPNQHNEKMDELELNEATAINMNHGWSQGHGSNIQSGVENSRESFMGKSARAGNDSGGISGAGGLNYNDDHDPGNMGGLNDNHNSQNMNASTDNHDSGNMSGSNDNSSSSDHSGNDSGGSSDRGGSDHGGSSDSGGSDHGGSSGSGGSDHGGGKW